jgi:hypothetical protein
MNEVKTAVYKAYSAEQEIDFCYYTQGLSPTQQNRVVVPYPD